MVDTIMTTAPISGGFTNRRLAEHFSHLNLNANRPVLSEELLQGAVNIYLRKRKALLSHCDRLLGSQVR